MGTTERSDPDYGWMLKDVGDQLDSCQDALFGYINRVGELRKTLATHVERGDGMTTEQVAELYVSLGRLFPQRTPRRRSSLVDPQPETP